MKATILELTLVLAFYVAVMSQQTTQSPRDCFRDATTAFNSTDPECHSMLFNVFSVSTDKNLIHLNLNCNYSQGKVFLLTLKLKVFAPVFVQSL